VNPEGSPDLACVAGPGGRWGSGGFL